MVNAAYQLLDSGHGRKLEQFGKYRLIRPCPQALWKPQRLDAEWAAADAQFQREEVGGGWKGERPLPASWEVSLSFPKDIGSDVPRFLLFCFLCSIRKCS